MSPLADFPGTAARTFLHSRKIGSQRLRGGIHTSGVGFSPSVSAFQRFSQHNQQFGQGTPKALEKAFAKITQSLDIVLMCRFPEQNNSATRSPRWHCETPLLEVNLGKQATFMNSLNFSFQDLPYQQGLVNVPIKHHPTGDTSPTDMCFGDVKPNPKKGHLGGFLKWGYPQSSSILRCMFPYFPF